MHPWNPKVTAAAVIERESRFLLVREHCADGIRLNQPAGHLDPGESLEGAVIRETREETGWLVRPTGVVGMYLSRYQSADRQTDVTYLRFTFACEPVSCEPGATLDDGIIEAVWMTEAQIRASVAEHRSPQVLQSLDDYLAGRCFPLSILTTDPRCVYENN